MSASREEQKQWVEAHTELGALLKKEIEAIQAELKQAHRPCHTDNQKNRCVEMKDALLIYKDVQSMPAQERSKIAVKAFWKAAIKAIKASETATQENRLMTGIPSDAFFNEARKVIERYNLGGQADLDLAAFDAEREKRRQERMALYSSAIVSDGTAEAARAAAEVEERKREAEAAAKREAVLKTKERLEFAKKIREQVADQQAAAMERQRVEAEAPAQVLARKYENIPLSHWEKARANLHKATQKYLEHLNKASKGIKAEDDSPNAQLLREKIALIEEFRVALLGPARSFAVNPIDNKTGCIQFLIKLEEAQQKLKHQAAALSKLEKLEQRRERSFLSHWAERVDAVLRWLGMPAKLRFLTAVSGAQWTEQAIRFHSQLDKKKSNFDKQPEGTQRKAKK
jgi:hypothetical protein